MGVSTVGHLPDGHAVRMITLGAAPGIELRLLDLGAAVHQLHATGGDGTRRNVVLGHPTPADYLRSTAYLGGTIGRYANRIAGGRFELDGTTIQVGANDRGNQLHGGPDGFNRRLWGIEDHDKTSALMTLTSPDGDQGFPGDLTVSARFTVHAERVSIELSATTNAPTVVNLTNHAYFNLAGAGSGTVDDHWLRVAAQHYTPVDDTGIPLGEHAAVDGSPFDLREPARLGAVARSGDRQIAAAAGIDHNYVLDGTGMRTVAALDCAATRTRLELATDQPGLQVYTGNFLDGREHSTAGGLLRQGDGIALEPQLFPDTPHHPDWPSAVLRPGETYRTRFEWVLSAR